MPRSSAVDSAMFGRREPRDPASRQAPRRPRRQLRLALTVLAVAGATLSGCGADDPAPASTAPPQRTLTVTSPAFQEGGRIPEQYTCQGAGDRPAIEWSGDVAEAVSFAVVVDDPDAPGFTYLHWVVFDIPADTRALPAGDLPSGVLEGQNSAGLANWAPPCPPSGQHRYRFTVYALKADPGLAADAEGNEARKVIESLAVGTGTLTGLFGS
ncbi:YbhB/YbcL family Raf kinase inhibitor-like protein [Plantactinospora sp. S1510]|uniref:YbhB/YbcL family Raf kinase inhibitor-like protein n=1 Tax=Plantactinospora alkalitolerans TaxID=2789879 RepID=A0ABS0H060_9ACTN|nr:YbhB/YbcL family Raf kinase inhibitor-like protein [Plantactinospora alkalitolerans]MBF9131848.1 YbhB/YbcL family Raf kinase inhibitor-like protein [Plantactinospora alkalitolerans]